MDNLIDCPCCGSNACSKTTSNGIDIYLCWTCGMSTSSQIVDGSDFEKENFELTAELIKD